MISLINTVRQEDYAEINAGVEAVKQTVHWVEQNGGHFEIGHAHRFWEYGSAVQAALGVYQHKMNRIRVLDVGSGCGVMGPTLAYCYGAQVTECEPNITSVGTRTHINKMLESAQRPRMTVAPIGFGQLPDDTFEVVTCISVIEHLPKAVEEKAWEELAKRVKWGGLLFITMDCVQFAGVPYTFDNLREQNFTTEMLKQKVEKLMSYGLTPMGVPNYTYNGPQVFDYTFFRMAFLKMESASEQGGTRNVFSSRTSDDVGRKMRTSRIRSEPGK